MTHRSRRIHLLIFGLIFLVAAAILVVSGARANAAKGTMPAVRWTITCADGSAVSALTVTNRSDRAKEYLLVLTEADFAEQETITTTKQRVIIRPGKAYTFTRTLARETDWTGAKVKRWDGALLWSDDYVEPVWDCL